jgi:ABC-type multidrug transport system fused ATPase/permease subunit
MIDTGPVSALRYIELLKFITPHRNALLKVFSLLLAGSALSLANPLMAGKVTEVLLAGPGEATPSVEFLLLAWLLLLVLRGIVGIANGYLVANTGELMSAELRSRVYEHMQALPLPWFQQRKQGEVLTLLSSDAELISRFVTNALVQLLPALLTLLLAFGVMAWIDPIVAAVAALLVPAYVVVTRLVGRRIRPLSTAWIESRSALVSFVNENLGLMPVLKAFAREQQELGRFADRNLELLEVTRQQIRVSSILSPIVSFLAGAGALLLLWIGIRHMQSGMLQPPELVALLLYVMLLTSPVSSLAGIYSETMRSRGAAERLLDFFGERPEPLDQSGLVLKKVKGSIEFRDVSFAYPGRPAVLRNFDLSISPRETIALTGPNGAGKSTLVHLLMRFMDPDQGTISIDGTDIAELELGSLRRQVGLVAQNTLLLNGTVAENIAYGQPHANDADVEKAAKAAHASSFIEKLPNGYATIVGDQGVKLSGGQRQRLSLARTLLKDPPILILDEATAMFDPEGEKLFLEECGDLFKQRTVILITHRPASLALADRIIQINPIFDVP